MIVAQVRFPIDVADQQKFIDQMAATTPKYEGLDGLIRKYYMIHEEGNSACGLYLWASKEKAQAWYNDEWTQYMTEAWGQPPQITYYQCPIVVDNEIDKTIVETAA